MKDWVRQLTRRGAPTIAAVLIALGGAPASGEQSLIINTAETESASVLMVDIGVTPFEVSRTSDNTVDLVFFDVVGPVQLPTEIDGRIARWVKSVRSVAFDEGTRLRILLDCECDTSTRIRDGVLTVAVRPPTDNLSASLLAQKRTGQALGGTANAPFRSPQPSFRPKPGQRLAGDQTREQKAPEPDLPEEVAAARTSLLKQLTRAADQGLVTFGQPRGDETSLPSQSGPADINEDEQTVSGVLETGERSPETRNETEIEKVVFARTTRDEVSARNSTQRRALSCPPSSLLALPEPVAGEVFSDAVQVLRGTLSDERGSLNIDVLDRLVRHYIANGFGEEALSLIKLAVSSGLVSQKKMQPLAEMADFVENGMHNTDGVLPRLAECDGVFLLWADVLGANHNSPTSSALLTTRLATALDGASPGLRELLGAGLLRAAFDRGDLETAIAMDAILRRTPVTENEELLLQRARLGLGKGLQERSQAWRDIARIAQGDSHLAAHALRVMAAQYAFGDTPPLPLVERLTEVLQLSRGGTLEPGLSIDLVRLTALAKGAPSAIAVLKNVSLRKIISESSIRGLLHEIFEVSPLPNPKDPAAVTAFGSVVIDNLAKISVDREGDEAREKIVEALLQSGFRSMAFGVLEPVEQRSSRVLERARGLLSDAEKEERARSALFQGTGGSVSGSAALDESTDREERSNLDTAQNNSAARLSEGGAANQQPNNDDEPILLETSRQLSETARLREGILKDLNDG